MLVEFLKFIFCTALIVIISKYILVKVLRKLAEAINLSSKTVGNIAGIATSVPEFLTISFSAFAGLIGTSVYNVLSSNIINLILYGGSIFINKNQKNIRNKAIRIDLILVAISIFIPILILFLKIEYKANIVPIFILLFLLFYYINNNAHKLYLNDQDIKIEENINKEKKWVIGKTKVIIKYSFYLLIASVSLYVVGNYLSTVLENLAINFKISETFLGITLGIITSIPELITFFEAQRYYKKEDTQLGVVEATNNLLTSNMLNLFIIQSVGIIIYSFIQ